jgi:hypothetical protein
MRKISNLLALVLFISTAGNAQINRPKATLGFSAVYSMPQGDFKKDFKYGVGGEVYGGVGLGKTFFLATVGYRGYAEDVTTNPKTLSFIPLKVGVKQLLLIRRLFIQGNSGVASLKQGEFIKNTGFSYDVGGGLRLAGLELGLFYEAFKIDDAQEYSNTLNAKFGYHFTL